MRNEEILEKQVEKYFNREVKNLGGKSFKWVSPGSSGVLDRIVVWPGGLTTFVEIKQEKGKLRPQQMLRIKQLNAQGAVACVVYGKDGVDKFIREYKRMIDENTDLFTKPDIGLSIDNLIYR